MNERKSCLHHVVELKRWLKCRGDTTASKKHLWNCCGTSSTT